MSHFNRISNMLVISNDEAFFQNDKKVTITKSIKHINRNFKINKKAKFLFILYLTQLLFS